MATTSDTLFGPNQSCLMLIKKYILEVGIKILYFSIEEEEFVTFTFLVLKRI